MSILIWTSFSNKVSKLRCNFYKTLSKKVAFSLFDMNKDNIISYQELEIFFIASCRGLGKFLNIPMPKSKVLKQISCALFYRYDINKSLSLEFEEYFFYKLKK